MQGPDFARREWVRLRTIHGAPGAAPPVPGIYAMGAVATVGGLPVRIDWIYVGQASNLRARLQQHDPLAETNPLLREFLASDQEEAELWFTTCSLGELNPLEQILIKALQPSCNRRGK
jgi:excinuclease UvrABC nuclease subunit